MIEIVSTNKHHRKQAHRIGKAAMHQHWSMFSFLIAHHLSGFVIRVAQSDGVVAGYAAMVELRGGWRVAYLAVDESHRNKGVATRLMEDLADIARSYGATSLLLEVRRSAVPARRLYDKLGFIEEKVVPNYYKTPKEMRRLTGQRREDAIVMRLRLT